MQAAAIALLVAPATGLIVAPLAAPCRVRAPSRVHMMADLASTLKDDPALVQCLVDASGYDEINACWSPTSEPAAPSPLASFSTAWERFANKFNPPASLDIDIEECMVDAENPDERAACMA